MSKGARFSLSDAMASLGPRARAEIEAQLKGTAPDLVPGIPSLQRALQPMKDALRQKKKGPNKTELAFAEHLALKHPTIPIEHEPFVMKLGNGVRYIPDFFLCIGQQPTVYEVKGFMREDAAAKIKMAASKFKWIQFNLVFKRTKAQGGGWEVQRVLP